MNLLTVARRASLGKRISDQFTLARARFVSGSNCSQVVVGAGILNPAENEFFESMYITGLVSTVEATVADLATEFLKCYPGHLAEKSISLDTLDKAGSIGTAIAVLAEKNANEWSYRRFSEFVGWALGLFDSQARLPDDLIANVTEIKATRDVYVHANGVVNNIYLTKAANFARSSLIGGRLGLGHAYVTHAEQTLGGLLDAFETAIPDKFKQMGRVSAFTEMWNATCLCRLNAFEECWQVEARDMIRPLPKVLEWHWSHSEKMLVDFFLGMYAQDHDAREYDMMAALRRWEPASNEAKVMASWSNAPFWF
jgi:hypothetical protein